MPGALIFGNQFVPLFLWFLGVGLGWVIKWLSVLSAAFFCMSMLHVLVRLICVSGMNILFYFIGGESSAPYRGLRKNKLLGLPYLANSLI